MLKPVAVGLAGRHMDTYSVSDIVEKARAGCFAELHQRLVPVEDDRCGFQAPRRTTSLQLLEPLAKQFAVHRLFGSVPCHLGEEGHRLETSLRRQDA